MRQSRLRTDGLVPLLRIDQLAAVDPDTSGVARCGRSLRNTVQVQIGLRRRVADTPDPARKEHAEIQPLPRKVVAPRKRVVRKDRTQVDVIPFVGQQQVPALVHLDVAVVVEAQVRGRIEVAQRAALLQDILRLAQSLDVELFEVQGLARHRIHGIGRQFDDLVAVPRVGEVRRPTEIAPAVVITRRKLDSRIADVARLQVDRRIGGRGRQRGVERLVLRVGLVPRG